jgi:hypothetical protein
MIAFSWTFPRDVPELRYAGEMTQVVVLFDEQDDGQVRVCLFKHGWQDGEAWDRGWEYCDRAWDLVLERLADDARKSTPPRNPRNQHHFCPVGNWLLPVIAVNHAIDRNSNTLVDAFLHGGVPLAEVLHQFSNRFAFDVDGLCASAGRRVAGYAGSARTCDPCLTPGY